MVSPVINEQFYTAGFIVSEAPGTYSRDVVVWDNTAGAVDILVQAGVIFSVQAYGIPVVTPKAGNTGNGTFTAVSPNTQVTQLGAYIVTLLTPTTFSVAAPDGSALANGTVGTPYDDGVAFKITAGGTAFAANDGFTITFANGVAPVVAAGGSNVGNGTLGSVNAVLAATAMLGNYQIVFTGATTFNVIAPDGRQLQPGITGTLYEDELQFLVTAGGTAFVAGDSCLIGIGAGNNNVVAWTGQYPAAGIAYNREYVPAGGTRITTAIMRAAEVAGPQLQYPAGTTAAARLTVAAQLKALGILVRPPI